MPHRKERPSGSSLHAQGSAGTAVRASRVGWSAAGGHLFALFLSTCSPVPWLPFLTAAAFKRWLLTGCTIMYFLKQKCS